MSTELKSRQQQIYDAVFLVAYNLENRVFDYLSANEVSDTIVLVGEYFNKDRKNKSFKYGNMVQIIHVYHDHRGRRESTSMIDKIKAECEQLKRTENFYTSCKNTNDQVMLDNSTGEPLLHGILEVEFQFH